MSLTGNKMLSNWWTLSPYGVRLNYLQINVVSPESLSALSASSSTTTNSIRPVISISECAKVKSGFGTPESPYEIYENSCN